ncbi:MAG TPA: hypothetical protein V6D47_12500 [Oscillatoriaceae cyanobacterium]
MVDRLNSQPKRISAPAPPPPVAPLEEQALELPQVVLDASHAVADATLAGPIGAQELPPPPEEELSPPLETGDAQTPGKAPAERKTVHRAAHSHAKHHHGSSLWGDIVHAVEAPVHAVSTGIEDVGKALGKGVSEAGHLAADVAEVPGEVGSFGLGLVSKGLDALGAHGAAQALDDVKKAVDFGDAQLGNFTRGVGDALGDTVTGLATAAAHPVDAVEGVASLAVHPSEIPQVAEALWKQASKGGIAHAAGYIAGNLAPALLSGGSAEGATLAERAASVVGQSDALSAVVDAAKASTLATKGGELLEAARGSALAQGAAEVAKQVGEATALPGKALGKVADRLGVGDALEGLGEKPGLSHLRKAASNLADKKRALNTALDHALGDRAAEVDGTAFGRAVDGRLGFRPHVTHEGRLAELEGHVPASPIGLAQGQDLQGLVDPVKGLSPLKPERLEADGPESAAALRKQELSSRTVGEVGPARRAGAGIPRLGQGDLLEGTAARGGVQPNILADYTGPQFEARLAGPARAIAQEPALSETEKVQRIVRLVHDTAPPNSSPELNALLRDYHEPFLNAKTNISTEDYLNPAVSEAFAKTLNERLTSVERYLGAPGGERAAARAALPEPLRHLDDAQLTRYKGLVSQTLASGQRPLLVDCRGLAALTQMTLQSAGLKSGIVLAKAVIDGPSVGYLEGAEGLTHYYNVVELDGKQIVADAFNPQTAGLDQAELYLRGVSDMNGARTIHFYANDRSPVVIAAQGRAVSRAALAGQTALDAEAARG